MSDTREFSLTLTQESDYAFRVEFDDTAIPALHTDEPAPLGGETGPNPSRLLVAAVANCLSASLLFSLRKFRNAPGTIVTRARARLERNEDKRWRIAAIVVDLQLADAAGSLQHVERALAQFEAFCIVTESVRGGVPVAVRVQDGQGVTVHTTEASA